VVEVLGEIKFPNVSGVIVESISVDPAMLDPSKRSYGYSGIIMDMSNGPKQSLNQSVEEEYPGSAD